MNCDYCGLATGAVASWEVSAGVWPGDGMTRYVCDVHLASAVRHVSARGEVRLWPANSAYREGLSAVLPLPLAVERRAAA